MDALTFISKLFQNAAEWLLIASRVVMLRKVIATRSVSGLSLKTNLIYLITYCLRYIHVLRWYKYSWRVVYANIIKTIFLGYQIVMVYMIMVKYRKSYYKRHDNFPMSILLIISFVVGYVVSRNIYWSYYEDLCYNTSLCLESVAILPQLVMTQEAEDCESMNSKYIGLLGLYRGCYLIHFAILKYQSRYIDMLMIVTAIIQTGLYMDFFYVYYQYVFTNKESGINLEKKGLEKPSNLNNQNVFNFENYTKTV